MDTFLLLLVVFVAVPVVARYYSDVVHWLGALAVRILPARIGGALSRNLYRTEYDDMRDRDQIAAARHAKERKEGIAHKGELQR